MFLFAVVIDYAYNPQASTGKFECLYRTPTISPTRYNVNELEVKGFRLPLDYFYKGKIEMEDSFYTSQLSDKQRDINKMLRKLKSMYESDIMKVPDCENCVDKLDKETCIHKTHTDAVEGNNTEEVDELTVDKVTSDLSVTSKKESAERNSTSISSINLLKKCYKSKSATNVNSALKNSLSKCTSSMAFKVPFSFSKLDDSSNDKTSGYSLLPGSSNGISHIGTKYSKHYNTQRNFSNNKTLNKRLNNEIEEYIDVDARKKTVKEITKKIFDFLQTKQEEYKCDT